MSSALSQDHAMWKPQANPWMIAVSVMLGTFMEVLDTSIANVALPHIAGSMSITPDDATWVLTSYLISNAVVLTAAGWLSRTFGRKRFLLTCIMIFAVASVMAGAAPNFPFLIFALVIQGAGGGALQPSAQAILLESFPTEKRGQAMAFYTFGVICAPVIGPTLGGWITDSFSWRWVFYINIPVAIVAFLMVQTYVEDPPYIRHAVKTKLDMVGFILLSIWIAALQIMLDKGQDADWFGAVWVRWFAAIAVLGFLAFIVWELTSDAPLVDLRVLKNHNLLIGTILIFIVGIVLYATTALLPLFLQTLMGYSALDSGLAVSPRGLGSVVGILLIGRLTNLIDNRFLMISALVALAYSSLLLGHVDTQIGEFSVTWPIIINGFATSMLFIPLTTTAVGTLRNDQMGNATSIYNLMRNIGGAFGISITTALLSRESQISQNMLVSHTSKLNPVFNAQLHKFQGMFSLHAPLVTAHQQALALIYQTVGQQAGVMAYIFNFRLMALLVLCCIPFIFFLKIPKHRSKPVDVH
ncbi:MAG: DHA2 family efflux MFS transporter permease subunit [Phycisphaerae bacterium]